MNSPNHLSDVAAVKKPYYHWLERAQVGSIDCAIVRFPQQFHEQYLPLIDQQLTKCKKWLVPLPQFKSFESFETRQSSLISDLVRTRMGHFQKSIYAELTEVLSLGLTNETQLNLDQIGQYDFGFQLAREINPVVLEKQFDFSIQKERTRLRNFMKFLGRYDTAKNEYLMGFVLLELIDNLLLLQTKHPQFKVYLEVQVGEEKWGLPFKDLHVLSPFKGEYEIRPVEQNEQPYLGGCYLSQDTAQVHVHNPQILALSPSQLELESGLLSLQPIEKTSRSESMAFAYFGPQFEKSGADYIYKNHTSLPAVQTFLAEQKIPFHFSQTPHQIRPSRSGVNLHHYMDPGFECIAYSMWTEFIFNNDTYRIHNFQLATQILLQSATQGIVFFSPEERKDMASQRRGHRRENDLKFLKHQGLMCLILIEASRYILNKPLTTGQYDLTDEQFIEIIELNVFNLFKRSIVADRFGEANPFEKHLSAFLSDKVYDFFKATLSEVLRLLRTSTRWVCLQNQFIELTDFPVFTAEALLLTLEPMMFETRGELLTRGQSKFLDHLVTFAKYNEINEPVFKNTAIETDLKNQYIHKIKIFENMTTAYYSKLSELSVAGWDVLINTKSLEKLDESDFKTELTMNDNKLEWFELSPKVFFKGVEVQLEDLNFSGKGKTHGVLFYKGRPYLIDQNTLPRLNALESFWEKLKNDPANKGQAREKEYVKLPRAQILDLLALVESGTPVITENKYWKEIYSFYKKLGSEETRIELPSHLIEVLKPHQKVGTQWIHDLYKLQLGGILADDMGLGKTLQVLTFLDLLYTHNENKKAKWSLIIVPTSLVFNWESEAKKFTPNLPVEIFQPHRKKDLLGDTQSSPKILIATYGLLTEHEDFFAEKNWDLIVFDEAQNLKNLSSKRTSSARVLKAKFKLALSGTPLENNFMDFFSLADLVLPGSMGSYKAYQEVFGAGKTIDATDVQYLKLKMKPLVLRRTKDSVKLNLPKKLEETLRFQFSEKQLEIYKNLAISHNDQVHQLMNEKAQSAIQLAMLTALLRLRQVCSDPSGVPNVQFDEVPPKIEHIIECIKEHFEEGRSVLIFTQFLATLNRISELLDQHHLSFQTLHGSVAAKNRREILDRFQNSDHPQVLLMTLKTGGVGLNLTKASVVYHVEPWWNPAVENQATDRSHRLGQTSEVQVYRLIMKDSVEEKIEILKTKKKVYFDSLFSDAELTVQLEAGSNQLSAEDFKYLLSL